MILRQNHASNQALFDAFDADLVMVPSRIIAHECLAILTTPLLVPFLDEMKRRDDSWCADLVGDLTHRFGWSVPTVWSERLNMQRAPALYKRLMQGEDIMLGDLLRSPAHRDDPLPVAVLYIQRDNDDHVFMPGDKTQIHAGDELLMVGLAVARPQLDLTLTNAYALHYILSGEEKARGWIWQWITERKKEAPASRSE